MRRPCSGVSAALCATAAFIGGFWGGVNNWVRDCSQDGDSKRRTALERDHNLREGDYDTVEDSAEILSSRMDLLRLLP